MSDDWKRLGDIVKAITDRLEVIEKPPLARSDADLFVMMLTEIYGPAAPPAVSLSRPEQEPAGDEA